MSFTVTMPQLGETVTEGTILRWIKQPGDAVAEDDVLLEISTDKVDTEVPSPFSGTLLEVLVPEGDTVDVGTPLCIIGDPGEAAAASDAGQPAGEPAQTDADGDEPLGEAQEASSDDESEDSTEPDSPTEPDAEEESGEPEPDEGTPDSEAETGVATGDDEPEPGPSEASVSAAGPADLGVLSPVVRKLAAENDIDLTQVTGTGSGGRITRRDIESFIESGAAAAVAEPAVEPEPEPEPEPVAVPAPAAEPEPELTAEPEPVAEPAAEPEPVTEPAAEPAPAPAAAAQPASSPATAGERVEELPRLRSRIAENMIRAKQTAAHVWTSMEVDFERVEQFRQLSKEAFRQREGFGLTYLPFISRAVMDALSAYPVVNSSLDVEAATRTFHGVVNLGIGVDLNQEGLVVMTIRGADGLRMRGIAREVKRLADKARDGNMEPDDLAGSTFTITNPGPFGSYMSAPIINVPNVAILSTDAIVKRPVVVKDKNGNDAVGIHHIGVLSLTWDHRAFDGSTAVLFLRRIKDNIETWDWEQELA